MTGLDVLKRELAMADEWRLGAGGLIRWTPSCPKQIDSPGFRDPGCYLDHPLNPVFAISVLDRDTRQWPLRAQERNWNPARLELKYRLPQALLIERRAILGLDTFVSHWTMTHSSEVARQFWILLWTHRPDRQSGRRIADLEANPQGISFQEYASDPTDDARWGWALGSSYDADSWSVVRAESSGPSIHWETSPFFDLMAPGGLPGKFPTEAGPGQLYLALAYPFEIGPGERLSASFVAALAPDVEQARGNLEQCVGLVDPIQQAEEEWLSWFEEAPSFACSDRAVQRAYWGRWAERRIFSVPQAIETPLHANVGTVIESSWLQSSNAALEALQALLRTPDASLFDQGLSLAVRRLLSIHPDAEAAAQAALRLTEAVDYWDSDRLPTENAADPWGRRSNQEVDSLARAVFLRDALYLLDELADGGQIEAPQQQRDHWLARAMLLGRRIDERFGASDPSFPRQPIPLPQGERLAKTAHGFLPLLTGLLDGNRRREALERLANPEEFWTPTPVPSLSRDDPDFDADGCWHHERLDNPYHGRGWSWLTSHVVDALGRGIEQASAMERVLFGELVRRVLRRGLSGPENQAPRWHRHYHPMTGRPALHLGAQQSDGGWMIDHLLRYLVGIRPEADGQLVVDPLPMSLEWFEVRRLFIGDHELEIDWDHRGGLNVRIDEEPAGHAPIGQALFISLPDHWEHVLD